MLPSFNPQVFFPNNLVRLNRQSVALIPTITVVHFQPYDIMIFTRSQQALREIQTPYTFFTRLFDFARS